MSDITIPPEAVEAAARKIAALKMGLSNDGQYLPDDLWRQALPQARAAIRHHWKEGRATHETKIVLPKPSRPRER